MGTLTTPWTELQRQEQKQLDEIAAFLRALGVPGEATLLMLGEQGIPAVVTPPYGLAPGLCVFVWIRYAGQGHNTVGRARVAWKGDIMPFLRDPALATTYLGLVARVPLHAPLFERLVPGATFVWFPERPQPAWLSGEP